NSVKEMLGGKIERRRIAGSEQLILALVAAAPYRPDRMDDVLRLEPVAFRDLRRSRLAPAHAGAFTLWLPPRGAMDRAIHTAAAEQRAVRRIHDRVDIERGDV